MQYQSIINNNGERLWIPILAGAAILTAPFWLGGRQQCCNNNYYPPQQQYPAYQQNYYQAPYPPYNINYYTQPPYPYTYPSPYYFSNTTIAN